MSDSVAQDQIVAFVDRILRMKGEAKAIKDDIRDIYAEAKSNGFDKTVLGKLVGYVEKREADGNAVAEAESIFDLYLSAYDSAKRGRVGTRVATHTHAPEVRPTASKTEVVRHDAETGEILDPTIHSSDAAETGAEDASGGRPDEAPQTNLPVTADENPERPICYPADPLRSEAATRKDAVTAAPGPHSPEHAPEQPRQTAPLVITPKAPGHNSDPRCLNKAKCGEFSNYSFCRECKAANAQGRAA